MATANYHPEPYWNAVAKRIAARNGSTLLAGDDEPYYQYKRNQFLKQLRTIPFQGKVVLEIGCGPGGNLLEIAKQHPKELHGVDIAEEMVQLAKRAVVGTNIQLQKTDGVTLPFAGNYFDSALTSTVLQHITNETMLQQLVSEISRVTKRDVYSFERIEPTGKGTELCAGRSLTYYQSLFAQHRFELADVKFLNIPVSYFVSGAIRKLFNRRVRKEGEAISALARLLQRATLPITAALDPLVKQHRELAMLHFRKEP